MVHFKWTIGIIPCFLLPSFFQGEGHQRCTRFPLEHFVGMHPVTALATLGGFGLMAVFAGIAIWEIHQQQRAFRESAYHSGHPSHAEYVQNAPSGPNPDDAQDRVLQGVYAEARDDLRRVSWMHPGDERRRAVRALRTRYHPDRYPVSLRIIMTEVSSFINVQTEHLL
ncbi:hypothetical protein COCOBI_18-0270 [Coccomyxa sp. Obi]|nr:hypothetical protein COCOBI_18-0270 [Coccomyxa sp. Obi]